MNLTREVKDFLTDRLSLEDALPTQMPVYVNSIVYLFGASALSTMAMLILTGVVMSLFGPGWYHVSRAGHFVNSLHFWSVQVFFGSILLHMAGKYLMAAWRDGRWKTWMAGMLSFGAAVFAGVTGFLSQTNWDSQWIAVQAKDVMNALAIGAFFNAMDTAQVLTLHVAVFPILIVTLAAIHLFFIRSDGPVKPFPEGGAK